MKTREGSTLFLDVPPHSTQLACWPGARECRSRPPGAAEGTATAASPVPSGRPLLTGLQAHEMLTGGTGWRAVPRDNVGVHSIGVRLPLPRCAFPPPRLDSTAPPARATGSPPRAPPRSASRAPAHAARPDQTIGCRVLRGIGRQLSQPFPCLDLVERPSKSSALPSSRAVSSRSSVACSPTTDTGSLVFLLPEQTFAPSLLSSPCVSGASNRHFLTIISAVKFFLQAVKCSQLCRCVAASARGPLPRTSAWESTVQDCRVCPDPCVAPAMSGSRDTYPHANPTIAVFVV